jgi:hypothetical protein
MTRTMRTLVLVAALAACLSVGVAFAATGKGQLALVGSHPVVVRGTHFQPRERVRVRVMTPDGSAVRVATAGATGTFVVRFPSLSLPGCPSYAIRAVGADGSYAVVRVVPECANGPTP